MLLKRDILISSPGTWALEGAEPHVVIAVLTKLYVALVVIAIGCALKRLDNGFITNRTPEQLLRVEPAFSYFLN